MKTNLIFFLARFGLGGAGNSVFRLSSSLDTKKYEVHIICLGKCAYENNFQKKNIKVHKIKKKRLIFSVLKLKKIVEKLTKTTQRNIFISNINYTNIFCSLIFMFNNKLKLIGFERTPIQELEIYFNLTDFIKKNFLKFLLKISYNRFDKIICNSNYIVKQLKSQYKIDSTFIHPPSIVNNQSKIFKRKFTKEKIINILTICRLSREKKINEILLALNKIKNKHFIFHILGEGPEKNKLKYLVNKLGLTKKVIFHGHIKNVNKILKSAHLYINSSYFEGFPNSVVEAANMGVPIIASQSFGGINEILEKGKFGDFYYNGYEQLATKIEKYIIQPKKLIDKSRLCQENIRQFTLESHIKKFELLINEI